MDHPKVTSYDAPHSSVLIEFPNGVSIMVCDETGEEGDASVAVTATLPPDEKVRFQTASSYEPIPA